MRELFVKTLSIRDEKGELHNYDYSILIDEMNVGAFSCESYGLQVREQERGELCAVPNITCSISRIDELCERVLSGSVTPVSLRDVVQDWL